MTAPLRVLMLGAEDESPEDLPADGLFAAAPSSLHPLTLAVLTAVQDLTTAKGWPPSVREIARATGIRTTSHAVYHLRLLEAAGLIQTGDGYQSRTLALTSAGWDVLLASEGCGLPEAA